MNNIETLLAIGITAISSGVAIIQTDIVTGIVLVVIGVGLIFVRGKLK